jgi:uncharacterized protein (DUF983 family)
MRSEGAGGVAVARAACDDGPGCTGPAINPKSIRHMEDPRDTRQALLRGLRLKCPCCGQGKVLSGYLTVRKDCAHCGQRLDHASVDDGPAYFTLLLVVAIVFPMFGLIYSLFTPRPLLVAIFMVIFSTILALVILPRVKGVFIGFQWAKRLHGF